MYTLKTSVVCTLKINLVVCTFTCLLHIVKLEIFVACNFHGNLHKFTELDYGNTAETVK